MPLPLTVSCFSKIQIGLPFWYWPTWVVLEKGPLNQCVCVCVFKEIWQQFQISGISGQVPGYKGSGTFAIQHKRETLIH